MELGRIILGCIIGAITILLAVYVSFTVREKGPILSNSYIWLSKEQQKKVDRKAEYKLVSVIYSGLCFAFLFLTIYIFTDLVWALILCYVLIIIDIVYAIYKAIKETAKTSK